MTGVADDAPPRAGYLPVEGADDVFAVVHAPAGEPAPVAALFCPPFGWEETASYRSRRDWAQHLAARGHWALRFDLPGAGDSPGGPSDTGLLAAWTAATDAAARHLAGLAAPARIVAIGIGLGGMLAWKAAAAGAPIDDLVLWATPADGRRLVRELRAFSRLETSRLVESGGVEPPPPPEGTLAPGGFLLSAETIGALRELRLDPAGLRREAGRRALVLGRDGIEPDPQLVESLQGAGVEVETGPGAGHGAMMVQPDEARPPLRTFAVVDEWLSGAASAPAQTRAPAGALPKLYPALSLGAGAGAATETPLRIAHPGAELFGVLAEPPGAAAPLTVVMLNAGAIRRAGPDRMWVEAARRWAARGVPSLRLDVEGIGDAGGEAARYARLTGFYVPEMVDQVRAALDALEERGRPGRFVLLGLCAGAYWAFHAALEDERVPTALMVNPRALYWDEGLEARREARRLALLRRPTTWRRLGRGEVGPARVGRFVSGSLALARQLPSRVRGAERTMSRIDVAFDRLAGAGKRALFVFGEGEPLRDELERAGRLPPSERWPGIELVLIEGRDHTLRPLSMQRAVHAALDAAVEVELAAADAS